ncbi:Response regulator/GGDEF domain protein [Alkalibacterium sp. AK22]|uniref:sensor domain-containing diguanylate cyclase n=1 Tax=Alkalibacterium sp. AK22 TaxID=1229520 RepID=UPI0004490410|nr:sensor domain-containing diguanylate cyclase [Alkalibacterium sp. AK22]EXJ22592.1 Response regulator/GGDEF domain protein [Alkalibacterium sp. AK22]
MRKYSVDELSREELIDQIDSQAVFIQELLKEKEAQVRLDYPWKGNLGHWYWNVQTNEVMFNPLKAQALGYTKEELPEKVPYDFFTSRLHPDDYDRIMSQMAEHLNGSTSVYEVEYRIRAKDGSWKWYYDRGKVTRRLADGSPLFASGIVFDITWRKEKEENLEDLAATLIELMDQDELTGIFNRRSIMGQLKAQMSLSGINKEPLIVAMVDIDDFKQINDSKGHVFGDYVLKETAKALKDSLGTQGMVGRYGGEEFLLILPVCSIEAAKLTLENCRVAVIHNEFLTNEAVSVSIGFALYQGGQTLEDLVTESDMNLYCAKAQGKNCVIGLSLDAVTLDRHNVT